MATFDPYELLGLGPAATPDEIRAAYRRRAAEWHPDVQPPDKRAWAQERMIALNAARDLLLDTRRRMQYHRAREESLRWQQARAQWQAQQAQGAAGPAPDRSWAAGEERRRGARRRFYGRLAIGLMILTSLIITAVPSLMLQFGGNTAEVRAPLAMATAGLGIWLSLVTGALGTLFFAVVLALVFIGLGRLLKR